MTRRATWAAWLALSAGVLGTRLGQAADNVETNAKTESAATLAVPEPTPLLQKMNEAPRSRVRPVVEHPTLSARGPVEVFQCKPEMYYRLLDHPDRASQTWRKLGAQCVPIQDRGQGRFGWADTHGSDLQWETVYRDAGTRVWYATGKVRPAPLVPLVS